MVEARHPVRAPLVRDRRTARALRTKARRTKTRQIKRWIRHRDHRRKVRRVLVKRPRVKDRRLRWPGSALSMATFPGSAVTHRNGQPPQLILRSNAETRLGPAKNPALKFNWTTPTFCDCRPRPRPGSLNLPALEFKSR